MISGITMSHFTKYIRICCQNSFTDNFRKYQLLLKNKIQLSVYDKYMFILSYFLKKFVNGFCNKFMLKT